MCATHSVPTRATADQEVAIVHWQIEQCLQMRFDKPTTIALVSEAIFLRARLPKSAAFVLVQLVWEELVKQNQMWFSCYQPQYTIHNKFPLPYRFSQAGYLQPFMYDEWAL